MTQETNEWRRLPLEEDVEAAANEPLDGAVSSEDNTTGGNNEEESSSSSSQSHVDDGLVVIRSCPRRQRQQQTIRTILFLTLIFEAITCFFRFGLGLQSTRDTASTVGRYTGGIRIHHGYLGIVLLLLVRTATSSSSSSRWCQRLRVRHTMHQGRWIWWMRVVGWSLIASDLIHHFLVLWPLTGSPHFDLVYPK